MASTKSSSNETEPKQSDTGTQPDPRLPYEPPAVISEEAFETLALACGKTGSRCVPNLNS